MLVPATDLRGGWPSQPSEGRSPAASLQAAVAVLGVMAMAATTAALTISGSTSRYRELEAVVRVLAVLVPIGVGLLALKRPPFDRFGALLAVGGALVFLASLSNSEDATIYSLGRIAGWSLDCFLIFLVLAYPTGRVAQPVDRALVRGAVWLLVLLFVPTLFFIESFPAPAPWMTCDATCPHNAFMLTRTEPGVIDGLVRPVREVALIALTAAVALRIGQRLRRTGQLGRRALTPVLAVTWVHFALYAAVVAGRRADADDQVVEAGMWLLAVFVPLLAVAFLIGLVRWWVFIASATQRLAVRLGTHPSPDHLRTALAEAFHDPSLQIVYWIGSENGHWGDASGNPLEVLLLPEGETLTEVADGPHRIAGIIHDAALDDSRPFIDAATSYVAMTFDNHRLAAQATSLVREVRQSRARIQDAADTERRRIERDLHDGAQQRLVALRIKLELVAEQADRTDGEVAAGLRALGGDVEEALDELRSFARGVYPPALADRGLAEGLRAAARRSPLRATVLAVGLQRYSRTVESAAYFVCLEALQNVAKHARGATGVVIDLSDNGSLRFVVRDDGHGFDPATVKSGVGFVSMADRVAAVGGELTIDSASGRGTRVTGSIPLNGAGAIRPG